MLLLFIKLNLQSTNWNWFREVRNTTPEWEGKGMNWAQKEGEGSSGLQCYSMWAQELYQAYIYIYTHTHPPTKKASTKMMLLEEKGRFILGTRDEKIIYKIREVIFPLPSTDWAQKITRPVLEKSHLMKCGEKWKSLEWSNRNDQRFRNMICKEKMKVLDLFNIQRKNKRGTEKQSPNIKRDFIKRDSNQ